MIAIYWAINYFKQYLFGQNFIVKTDHKPLTYSMKYLETSPRIAKWIIKLSEYDFKMVYQKGDENVIADALSRIHLNLVEEKELNYNDLIETYHKLTGHGSKEATLQMIKKFKKWDGMDNEVKKFIDNCDTCQRYSPIVKKFQKYPVLGYGPFNQLSIDLVGPIDKKFIVIATCNFSRYAISKVINSKSAAEISKFLEEQIFLVHGPIKSLLSDNGTEFINEVIEKLSSKWKFWQITSSPYYPQGNGLQERTNGTLILKLAKLYFEQKKNWEILVPYATFAYNISWQNGLRFSPFEIIFGRPINDSQFTLIQPNNSRFDKVKIHNLLFDFIEAKSLIRIQKINEKNTKLKSKVDLEIGDYVLIYDFLRKSRHQPKLSPRKLGPFKVSRKGSNGYYQLEGLDGKIISVNREHLVPYRTLETMKNLNGEEMLESRN